MKIGFRLAAVLVAFVVVGIACREQVQKTKDRSLLVYPTGIKGAPMIRVLLKDRYAKLDLSATGPFGLEVTHLDGREQAGGGDKAVTVRWCRPRAGCVSARKSTRSPR